METGPSVLSVNLRDSYLLLSGGNTENVFVLNETSGVLRTTGPIVSTLEDKLFGRS